MRNVRAYFGEGSYTETPSILASTVWARNDEIVMDQQYPNQLINSISGITEFGFGFWF